MELAVAAVDELGARASATALGLTARERQVLNLIADGSHDQEVAERLQLSRRTVQAHLRSVYAKLDVTTRTAAVHRATDLGLLGRHTGLNGECHARTSAPNSEILPMRTGTVETTLSP